MTPTRLDGFSHVYDVPLAAAGDLADFAKFGYNADAIVIEANDFGDGHRSSTAVDKAQAIAGNLVYLPVTPPAFNFRALIPAQMHGDDPRRPDVVHGLDRTTRRTTAPRQTRSASPR